MSSPLERYRQASRRVLLHDRIRLPNYHGNEARPTPGPGSGFIKSGWLVLALGGVALVLGHGGETLAFAGVQALAGMVAALAGALAFTGVRTDALTFAGGVGHGRHGRACQEQSGCRGGNCGARLGSHLHEYLLRNEV